MPELPEVQALAEWIDRAWANLRIASLDVVAVNGLKTVSPAPAEFSGAQFLGCGRRGKYLLFEAEAPSGPLTAVIHFARAGWLKQSSRVSATPARPGRGPLMARLVGVNSDGEPVASLDLTEAGTRKGMAIYLVGPDHSVAEVVPGIRDLGPDPRDMTTDDLAVALAGEGGVRLKRVLRDQKVVAGIGNAYSDEILHAARLSPYRGAESLTVAEVASLHQAMRDVLGQALAGARGLPPEKLKDGKRAGLSVHGQTGKPCPVCGTVIAEVSLADSSFQYCPGCQTGGRPLSDRRMSRLLK